jgi:hypothetical protein
VAPLPVLAAARQTKLSRRALQIVNGLLGLATVALGTVQLLFGIRSPLYAAANLPPFPILDSNLRFFGGMGLGLGLVLLWILPSIERRTTVFRAVWVCALLGGVGRLVSVAVVGSPSDLVVGFTVVEVVGAPVLMYWQHRVAAASVAAGPRGVGAEQARPAGSPRETPP